MPLYPFQHSTTGETTEVYYRMNDTKDYRGPDGDAAPGVWKRVYLVPAMSIDSIALDPYSAKDFARSTNKGGKMDDLWKRSEELSAVRSSKDGVDRVKETFYKDYAKRHKGVAHPEQKRDRVKRKAKEAGIKIQWPE